MLRVVLHCRVGPAGRLGCDLPMASAATDAYWLSSAGGLWSTPENWSTSPFVPANGVPTAHSTYHAIFDRSATPYTVSVPNLDLSLDGLTIRDAATVHQLAGTMELDALTIEQGRYLLSDGAVLREAEISVGAEGLLEIGHGLVADSVLSGTIRVTGEWDTRAC